MASLWFRIISTRLRINARQGSWIALLPLVVLGLKEGSWTLAEKSCDKPKLTDLLFKSTILEKPCFHPHHDQSLTEILVNDRASWLQKKLSYTSLTQWWWVVLGESWVNGSCVGDFDFSTWSAKWLVSLFACQASKVILSFKEVSNNSISFLVLCREWHEILQTEMLCWKSEASF